VKQSLIFFSNAVELHDYLSLFTTAHINQRHQKARI